MASRTVNTVVVMLSLLAMLLGACSEIFVVGGNRGWMVPNNGLNYTKWAHNISAHVGDSLYFKYNPNGHNVVKVNFTSFLACDKTDPLQIWDQGDTTVLLDKEGSHHFICGAPNHCIMFQAFSIDVLPNVTTASSPDAMNSTTPGITLPRSVGTICFPSLVGGGVILVLSFLLT